MELFKTLETKEMFLKVKIETEKYFSITGKTKYSVGCIHDEILEHFPNLKPLVDIHLSDLNGIPMYAKENGWYWAKKVLGIPSQFGPEEDPIKCLEILKKHLRTDIDSFIYELIEVVNSNGEVSAKMVFNTFVDNLKPQWKREAEKALELIQELVTAH